jgi:uncharacterized protein
MRRFWRTAFWLLLCLVTTQVVSAATPSPVIHVQYSHVAGLGYFLLSFVAGALLGILVYAKVVPWRHALPAGLMAVGVVAALVVRDGEAGLQPPPWWQPVLISLFAFSLGAVVFVALWRVRVVFYSVVGLIAYVGLLWQLTPYFGAMLWVYALVAPFALALYVLLAWKAVAAARNKWRRDRRSFYWRMWFPILVTLLVLPFAAGNLVALAVMSPFVFLCMLAVFGGARVSVNIGGMRVGEGSSEDDNFSGGGGRSGGGGASGSW